MRGSPDSPRRRRRGADAARPLYDAARPARARRGAAAFTFTAPSDNKESFAVKALKSPRRPWISSTATDGPRWPRIRTRSPQDHPRKAEPHHRGPARASRSSSTISAASKPASSGSRTPLPCPTAARRSACSDRRVPNTDAAAFSLVEARQASQRPAGVEARRDARPAADFPDRDLHPVAGLRSAGRHALFHGARRRQLARAARAGGPEPPRGRLVGRGAGRRRAPPERRRRSGPPPISGEIMRATPRPQQPPSARENAIEFSSDWTLRRRRISLRRSFTARWRSTAIPLRRSKCSNRSREDPLDAFHCCPRTRRFSWRWRVPADYRPWPYLRTASANATTSAVIALCTIEDARSPESAGRDPRQLESGRCRARPPTNGRSSPVRLAAPLSLRRSLRSIRRCWTT